MPGLRARNLVWEAGEVRRAHGLRPVRRSRGVSDAARRRTRDMVRRQYFAHTSPTGVTRRHRVAASSFFTRGRWYAGETLAWACGRAARRTTW